MAAVQTWLVGDEAGLDGLRDEWDRLLEQSDQRVYFLRWSWNRLWWRTYAPSTARLHIVTIRDGNGGLVGIAPFYWRRHRTLGLAHAREVLFLGTGVYSHTSEYLDVIARRGQEESVARAVARSLLARGDWERLWLAHVPSTSTVLPRLVEAMGMRVRRAPCDRSHHIDTRGEWETFRGHLGRSFRSNLAYYTRRLFREHRCSFSRLEDGGDPEPAIRELIGLHQSWWRARGEPGVFAFPRSEAFVTAAVREARDAGTLRLWRLTADSRPAAVLLAFLDHGVVRYYQSGFDPAYRRDSVGTVMLGLCIRDCFESRETREFDLMAGDAHYKASWTDAGRDSVEVAWTRSGPRSWIFGALRAAGIARRSATVMLLPERVRAAGRRLLARWRV